MIQKLAQENIQDQEGVSLQHSVVFPESVLDRIAPKQRKKYFGATGEPGTVGQRSVPAALLDSDRLSRKQRESIEDFETLGDILLSKEPLSRNNQYHKYNVMNYLCAEESRIILRKLRKCRCGCCFTSTGKEVCVNSSLGSRDEQEDQRNIRGGTDYSALVLKQFHCLLRKCLVVDPSERLSAATALKETFLIGC